MHVVCRELWVLCCSWVSGGTGHLLSWELGGDSPCRAKGDALGGSTTLSALSSLTQLLRVAAQTRGEPALWSRWTVSAKELGEDY